MTTSHKTKWRESLIANRAVEEYKKMIIQRTCPSCGETYAEHDTNSDRIGTLGSIYLNGVSYIVPMQVVSAFDDKKAENQRLSERLCNRVAKLIALTDAIDNFLNDTREKPALDALEQAMKDYGERKLQ